MANKYDLTLKISANSAELTKGLEQVKGKFSELGKHTESVMNAIGSAIGGIVGEIENLVTKLAAATGPIGVLVTLIGGIAMAWKEAQKGIEEYLKEEERAQYGKAGFNVDSKDARKETASRARSGIQEGERLVEEAKLRLALGINLSKVQKEELENQKQMGLLMQINNLRLLESVGEEKGRVGEIKKKFDWTQKYSGLLLQQEILEKKKISFAGELITLEDELKVIRTKITDKTTDSLEKAKLVKEFEEKAKVIADKKLAFLNEEVGVKTELYKMTGKNEQAELLALNTEVKKAEIHKAYTDDVYLVTRLENKVNSELGKQVLTQSELLRLQKEKNTHTVEGYAFGDIKGITQSPDLDNVLSSGLTAKLNAISAKLKLIPFKANLTNKEIDAINKENIAYEKQENILNGLTNEFENLFSSVDQGFKGIAKAFGDMLKYMAEQMLAKAAVFGLMKLLFPESALFEIGGKLSGGFFNNILPYASGTSYAPGGLSLVGERGPELVNIPRGSQVYSNTVAASMAGSRNINITVDGKIAGRDLALVLRRAEQSN